MHQNHGSLACGIFCGRRAGRIQRLPHGVVGGSRLITLASLADCVAFFDNFVVGLIYCLGVEENVSK